MGNSKGSAAFMGTGVHTRDHLFLALAIAAANTGGPFHLEIAESRKVAVNGGSQVILAFGNTASGDGI
jgi:hypothetical protein